MARVLERIVVEGPGGLPLTATIGNLPEAYPGGQVARADAWACSAIATSWIRRST
ncbi:hypothetical protein NKH56_33305 [Mesorhizobium sp. M1076]|uniref:hypothetical protein n=1 Tax=Mesorhizobium sp. M1076 TaxID=2957054 RepID=UPI00333818EA